MSVRLLPESLINQIAAGEVVERPASVIKELIENALDAGADQIVVDVQDGGRTLISVIDNGSGMVCNDLIKSITRHATSKLPDNNLLNINFMGFRGEALPSIASVSDMSIDTYHKDEEHGWYLDCTDGNIKPSSWEAGTRIRVANLFSKTPARLKFLRSDRAEMMSVLDVVKRLAMARPDVGFSLNNRWFFPKNQSMEERLSAVMGDDIYGKMLPIDAQSHSNDTMKLSGFISQPTMRRASSVDQYLFVNGRPVKDKVLVGALRAAYMDVMHAREFPMCALYLNLDPQTVDVNVSPAKTEVHFLEPARVRSFIIKTLRTALSQTLIDSLVDDYHGTHSAAVDAVGSIPQQSSFDIRFNRSDEFVARAHQSANHFMNTLASRGDIGSDSLESDASPTSVDTHPLGRVIGQFGTKYILAESDKGIVIVDQHAAHERIVYERLRQHSIKVQPLLTPIVVPMRPEEVAAVLELKDEMKNCGLVLDMFGDDALAIFEKPADWDLNWADLLHAIADEVQVAGHSSQLNEKLHLRLANYACHHSVRAGQRLDYSQMDALLRDVETTERAGQCNHGRPVYKIILMSELDSWFERI